MKRLIAFDLDGTLTESKQSIDPEMGALLARLTGVAQVAVISGGDWPQFERQFIGELPADADMARLLLLPTSGTKLYRYEKGWQCVFADLFTAEERKQVREALDIAVADAGLSNDRSWGEKIEDRGSQITFSGLGQNAPLEAKHGWDPDFAKRKRLQAILTPRLPGFFGQRRRIDFNRHHARRGGQGLWLETPVRYQRHSDGRDDLLRRRGLSWRQRLSGEGGRHRYDRGRRDC